MKGLGFHCFNYGPIGSGPTGSLSKLHNEDFERLQNSRASKNLKTKNEKTESLCRQNNLYATSGIGKK